MRKFKIADISEHNNIVDYDRLATACNGVMLRSSLGFREPANVWRADKKFLQNARELTARGVPIGAYHYSYAQTVEQAKGEAYGMLKVLKRAEDEGITFTLPIAFDMEDNRYNGQSDHGHATRRELAQMCFEFLKIIEEHGYFAILYASGSWLKEFYTIMPELSRFAKWCAHWDVQKPMVECLLWQYTVSPDGANYGQSGGRIDLNTTDIDLPAVIRQNGLNGTQRAKRVPQPRQETHRSEFVTVGEKSYYFDNNGKLLPKGIYYIAGRYYVIDDDGATRRGGRIAVNDRGQIEF